MMLSKEKQQTAFEALSKTFGYTTCMEAPRIKKIIVSTGTGKKRDSKQTAFIANALSRITGQQPAPRAAKRSVASFKVREGDPIGFMVTLRGPHMYNFLDKLIHIVLPRKRDFHGVPITAIDDMGNITIGVREHIIFPETANEDLRNIFGMAITIVTTAKTRKEAELFLRHIGFPLNIDAAKKS